MDFTENIILSTEYKISTEHPKNIFAKDEDLLSSPNFMVYCGFLFVGLIFNIIVMVTYCRKLKKSTYIFVFCLATCDVINILNATLELFLHYELLPWIHSRGLCIFQSFLADTGCLISANLVVCVALNRYLLQRHKNVNLSRRQCFYLVSGIVVCSTLVTLSFLIASANDMIYDNYHNQQTTFMRQYYDSSKERGILGLDQTSYFALTFNGVILTWLVSAFIVNIVLYIKMSYLLNKISNDRRKRYFLNGCSRRHAELKFERDSELIESCASSTEQLPCSASGSRGTVYDGNGNIEETRPIHKTSNQLNRRKSSAISLAHQSVTKTKKYIILVVLAITVFIFYFSHFVLHIIHIYSTKVAQLYPKDNDYIRSIVEIVGHSYILCFILNPILYCFFNRRFFRNFRQAVLCCDSYCKKTETRESFQQKRLSQDSTFNV